MLSPTTARSRKQDSTERFFCRTFGQGSVLCKRPRRKTSPTTVPGFIPDYPELLAPQHKPQEAAKDGQRLDLLPAPLTGGTDPFKEKLSDARTRSRRRNRAKPRSTGQGSGFVAKTLRGVWQSFPGSETNTISLGKSSPTAAGTFAAAELVEEHVVNEGPECSWGVLQVTWRDDMVTAVNKAILLFDSLSSRLLTGLCSLGIS